MNGQREVSRQGIVRPTNTEPCDHDWEWISDWYGDPGVVNGTADCSHYRCTVCGEEDHESDPPSYDEDFGW